MMISRHGVLMTVVAIKLVLSPWAAYSAEAKTQPNIILVFIDDMGWADFSCFGNSDAKTPNIDRMATEGIAFESFYVNSPYLLPITRGYFYGNVSSTMEHYVVPS